MENRTNLMRCVLRIAAFVALLFVVTANGEDFRNDPETLMDVYFQALREGDVGMISTLLTDPLLSDRRLLLQHNDAYPSHLQDYYNGSRMTVSYVGPAGEENTRVVNAKIFFGGDENPLSLQFLLELTVEGWKIAEELGAP